MGGPRVELKLMDKGRQPRNFRRINRGVLLCVIGVLVLSGRSFARSFDSSSPRVSRGHAALFLLLLAQDVRLNAGEFGDRSANDLSGGKMSRSVASEFEFRAAYACALRRCETRTRSALSSSTGADWQRRPQCGDNSAGTRCTQRNAHKRPETTRVHCRSLRAKTE